MSLAGKRVLVTRAEGQASETAELLKKAGAIPVVVPTIAIGPPTDPAAAERAIANLAAYDWVVFTSGNGVEKTREVLVRAGKDASVLAGRKLAAVGTKTAAALERHALRAQVVAREQKGEGLAADLLAAIKVPARVLLLRAEVARDVLPDALRAAGADVDVATVYRTSAPPDLRPKLTALLGDRGGDAVDAKDAADGKDAIDARGTVDAILFTSSSTVRNVVDALGPGAAALLSKVVVAVIGPITEQTAAEAGVRVDVRPSVYTTEALVAELAKHFA